MAANCPNPSSINSYGLLMCRRCKVKLPADHYGKTMNGHRQTNCKGCMTQFLQRKCVKCQRRLPRDSFTRTRLGKSRASCKDCFDDRLERTTARCIHCKKDVEKAEFPRTPAGNRSYACARCIRARPSEKWCKGCEKMLPIDDYPRRPLKTTNHFFRGKRCFSCSEVRQKTKSNLEVLAPNPCLHCGQKYRLKMHNYRREMRKYCSDACRHAAARRSDIICNLCRMTKPFEDFERKAHGPGIKAYCRDCGKQKANGTFIKKDSATSPIAMLTYVRRLARDRKQPCTVSPRFVASLVLKPCGLCGQEMRGIVPKDPLSPYDKNNLMPVCNECRRLLNARPLVEWIEWARLVTEGQQPKKEARPSVPLAVPRRVRREQAKNMPKVEWLHPSSQLTQPFKETFEEKLARYSRIAGERKEALATRRASETKQSRESRHKRRAASGGGRVRKLEQSED